MSAFTYSHDLKAVVSDAGAVALSARQKDGTMISLRTGSGNGARLEPSALLDKEGLRLIGAIYNHHRYADGTLYRTPEITHFVLDNNTQVATRADAKIKIYPTKQTVFALDLEATGFRSGSKYYSLGMSTDHKQFKPVGAEITDKGLVLIGALQSGETQRPVKLVVDEFQFKNGVTVVPDVDQPIERNDNVLIVAGLSRMAFNP